MSNNEILTIIINRFAIQNKSIYYEAIMNADQ